MSRKAFVLRGRGEPQTIVIEGRGGNWKILRGAEAVDAQTVRLPDGRLSILLPDGRQVCGRVLPRPHGEVEISTARGACRLALADPLHDRVDHAMSRGDPEDALEEIRALMPGRVVEVAVHPGDRVEAGSLLLVLEAMKMQNEIRASRGGIVERAEVSAGQTVEGGALMVTVKVGPAPDRPL